MESPAKDGATIEIKLTVKECKYMFIILDLRATHTFLGSITTACLYGIRKTTVIRTHAGKLQQEKPALTSSAR